MNLVSVIVPYFKKKKFINESLNSAINQSYKNIEIIIIYDDQNRDDLDYLNKLKDKDSRISIIINEKNFGAGISRNIGISKARGKYIAFLDSDDVWFNKKIEHQINFMIKNDLKCSHTSYEIIDEEGIVIGKRLARNFQNFKQLLKSCDIGLSTTIIEKSVFSEYCSFPDINTKEDFVLWLKILQKNFFFGGVDETLCYWRKSRHSLSSSILQKLKDGFYVYYKFMNYNIIKSLYLLLCLSLNYLRKK